MKALKSGIFSVDPGQYDGTLPLLHWYKFRGVWPSPLKRVHVVKNNLGVRMQL